MWLAPPTLDTARLHLKSGGSYVGGLLATANGSVYVVKRTPGARAAKITAFPIGEVSQFEIIHQRRPPIREPGDPSWLD